MTEERFNPPNVGGAKSEFGSSAIDVSNPENKKKMWNEYHSWRKLKGQERQAGEQQWYNTYFGMSPEDYQLKKKERMVDDSHPIKRLENVFQNLSLPGLGMVDFGMDVIGNVPGLGRVDDYYDKATELEDPAKQKIRNVLSVVLPSIMGGKAVAGKMTSMKGSAVQKALVGTGLFAAEEAAVIGFSDLGEEDNLFRTMSDTFPDVFGPQGSYPLPDSIKTLDSDSPGVRKLKNMYETAGLSVVGSTLGAFIHFKGGKKVMDWMEPLDDKAVKYKQLNLLDTAEPDKLIRAQQINEILSTKALSKQNEQALMDELMTINEELGIVDSVDDELRRSRLKRRRESTAAAKTKIDQGATQQELEFDVDVSPGIVNEAGEARQVPPSGNIARNMADTTAIKNGVSEGDPAPIITEAMQRKGLMVGPTSRGAVMGVAEEGRDTGRFNAIVDGFRFSAKQMNAAAWDIYTSIIAAENMDDLRGLFLENRDVKNMLLGRFKVEMFNEEQARAAAFAMRDLVDRYLGREVTEASARSMDTLGRESASMAQAILELEPFVDDNRAMDLIIEKMQFLMDEYGLNKYVSGWQLRNKNWFDQVPPKELDTVIDQLTTEFRSAENAIHAKNLKFTKTLKKLKVENPQLMRPLVDAYAHTNGDVDSIAKLHKWAANQITPVGLLRSPDPKQMNLFARSAWGVIYNNVLSGLSAFRAGIGNTSQLILKPITGVLGHGFQGLSGEWDGLRASFYYNGAVFETNRRALNDAYHMMKKAHKDPETMMKAYRKDFVFQESKTWDILENMRPVWEAEGNWGRTTQYDIAKTMRDLGGHPALRYGMTGMVFPDVFTNVHLAHYLSRTRAYGDVFSEFGYLKPDALQLAEAKHYKEMFDADGLIKDKALKALAGEVSLNLDDGVANWINKATTAYPITKHMLMFPRTSSNYIKNSLSWTPISLIPGINKYSKTIWANTPEEIADALLEHGVDMASTPHADILFKNLQAEYKGRLAFSALMTGTLYQYAMSGNIRGNGHYNASRRTKERTQMGYEPKTINIGGQWVSYKGIIGIEQVLSIIGDMAYYAKDIDEATLANWQAKLTWTLASTFLNETPLQGLEPLIAATNGDLTGWTRLTANAGRSFIPLSGAAGVLSNAITSTQKDIQGSVNEYLMNRLPVFSSLLPDQIDIWTGEPVNDIDNPFLRILNALNPLKVSGTAEPWRQWLLESGWDGLGRLRKDSTGSYEYTPEERELIYQFIGEQKMYKEIEKLMKNKKYNKELKMLRIHRSNNAEIDQDRIKLDTQDLPVFQEINQIVRIAQKNAEQKLLSLRPDIANRIHSQQQADYDMRRGNIQGAANTQKEAQTQKLLKINK